MSNLWSQNTPEKFWFCEPPVPDQYWQEAIRRSIHLLDLTGNVDIDELLALTLGEGRFGPNHWSLSLPKRLYYALKPVLPRVLIRFLRRLYSGPFSESTKNNWPIHSRYVSFQWELMRQNSCFQWHERSDL